MTESFGISFRLSNQCYSCIFSLNAVHLFTIYGLDAVSHRPCIDFKRPAPPSFPQ